MYSCETYPRDMKLRLFKQATDLRKISGEVVINGTFLWGNNSVGLVVIDGKSLAPNYYNRPVLVVKDNLAWIDPRGDASNFTNVDWAIGGGPAPLVGGQIVSYFDLHYEAGGIQPNALRERTAVGIKYHSVLVPMVFKKANARMVAEKAKELGCTDCIMLDGGGSSTWVENESLVFGGKRPVTTALVITKRIQQPEETEPTYLELGAGINDIQLTKNFNLREFQDKSTGEVLIDPELVERLQKLRDKVGPIRINSGYRTEKHNKEVGGAPDSQHRLGKAADISTSLSPEKLAALAEEIGFRGIGIYSTFVHVDTRKEKTKWRG